MAVLTDTRGNTYVTTDGHGRQDAHRRRGLARLSQFIGYAFWLLYTLLALRLLLVAARANPGSGFTQFIDEITNPFYRPFRGIVDNADINGQIPVAVPILIALIVYGLLHLAINKFFRVIAYRRTSV